MHRFSTFLLACLMLLSLTACGGSEPSQTGETAPPAQTEEADSPGSQGASEPEQEPVPEPEPYPILDPTVMPEGGSRDGVAYVAYDGVVEHLFFHPIVAYPELAFDGDYKSDGIDDWMVTAGEYAKILQSVYDKGYILWISTTAGASRPVRTARPGW